LFLPPSSPQLNPIEGIFGHLRTRIKKKNIESREDLMKAISEEMNEIEKEST
jgi:transposase